MQIWASHIGQGISWERVGLDSRLKPTSLAQWRKHAFWLNDFPRPCWNKIALLFSVGVEVHYQLLHLLCQNAREAKGTIALWFKCTNSTKLLCFKISNQCMYMECKCKPVTKATILWMIFFFILVNDILNNDEWWLLSLGSCVASSVGGLWFDGVSTSKFPWPGTYWPGGWKLKMGLMDMRFLVWAFSPRQVKVDNL